MLFCIGAQKAGTSWLYEYLGRSPNCHLTPFKELHYFDVIHLKAEQSHLINRVQQLKQAAAALAETPGPKNRKALNTVRRLGELLRIYTGDAGDHSAYLAYLAEGWSGQKLICDVTPSYATLDRTAFAEMAGIGQARFVFILRDPVGRLWSQTRMAVSSRQGGLGDAAFEAACMSRLREIHQEARMSRLPRSDYAGTVAELEAAVPAERIHYAFYEDLFSQASADRLCRFLDIASVPAETDEQVNLGRSLGLPAEAEALMFDALRPQYEAMFEKFGRAVPQAWRDRYAARKGREPA